jgi:hypothetical protein
MVNSEMMVLTEREKADADKLYPESCSLLLKP